MNNLIAFYDIAALSSALTAGKVAINVIELDGTSYLQVSDSVGTISHSEILSLATPQAAIENFAAGRVLTETKNIKDTVVFVWENPTVASDLSAEANAGIGFMGVTTTVLALFVGFGFAALPPVINAVLVAGLVSCLAALLAYANSTGVVARLGSRNAVRYMEVGNVLSEFGGIKLLLLVAPAALALQSAHIGLSLLVSAVVITLLWLIHYEKMNITTRYFSHRTETVHVIGDATIATTGTFAAQNSITLTVWSVVTIVYLLSWGVISWKKQEKLDS